MAEHNPLVFAHISDPHLSDLAAVRPRQLFSKRVLGYLSWRRRRRREHSTDVLDSLKQDLQAGEIAHLLVSGDLTHLGLPDEFRQARQWLESVSCSAVSVVPGNHDSYVQESWAETYQQWSPYFSGKNLPSGNSLEATFPTLNVQGEAAFIGLSTARPTAPFFATGQLGSTQLQKLSSLLAECGDKGLFRIVWLHHPPIPGQEKWRKRLVDADKLMAVLEAKGVELLLHGHSHRSRSQAISIKGKSVPVISVPSASARGWHGEVACYNRLRLEASARDWLLTVASRQFDESAHCFVPGDEKIWRIDR